MTPEQFTYWLQGKLKGRKIEELTKDELIIIQDHLQTVFQKVTPDYYQPHIPQSVPVPLDTGNPPPDWGTPTVIC